jgi:hypothetical protein
MRWMSLRINLEKRTILVMRNQCTDFSRVYKRIEWQFSRLEWAAAVSKQA